MKKGALIICIGLSLLVAMSAHAETQMGRIHIGNLRVIPGIRLQFLHDDNVYLSESTEAEPELSDMITHIMPAVGINYAFPERGALNLRYEGDLAFYRDYSDNDWQTHSGSARLDYETPVGLLLGIENTYTDAEDPYGNDAQYKLGVPKTERWLNDLRARIGYGFGRRFKAFGFYNFFKQDYKSEEDFSQDYDVNEFGAGFQMMLMPKTWGFFRYHMGGRDYFTHPPGTGLTEENDADFDWQRVNVGLTWDTGAKLLGELNLGYQWKEYEGEIDPNGNRYEDKDTWIAGTNVSFTATSTTTLSLSVTRALRESGANTSEYFEDTGIGLTMTRILRPRFTLSLSGTYSKNDYNRPPEIGGPNREADNYLASVGLNYRVRDWLSAGLSYAYREKESNYREDEFTDNQFMISLDGVY
jgi:hypothetical protein